jgi:hypothetical protein
MSNNTNPSRREHLKLVLLAITAFLICGCVLLPFLVPSETRAPQAFPDADLVFVAGGEVGFVNADGSGAAYLPFRVEAYGGFTDFWRPVVTADRSTLIVKVIDEFYAPQDPHLLAVWHAGEYPVLCVSWNDQQLPVLTAGQGHLFIQTEAGIAVQLLENCGTQDPPLDLIEGTSGIPSPDLQLVVYTIPPPPSATEDRSIVVRNLADGAERTIGEGAFPSWSRDSQWLAYTGRDGLYVVNVAEGSEPRRVILYPNAYDARDPTYAGRAYWDIPPEVSWSPDGKWLVYDRWVGTDYNTGTDTRYHSIYKLNVETGEETKIIDGGMYPSWRWPVEP